MNKKGFTLVELLVVISFIALLSSVVFTSIDSARIKARNAQRIANANAIATGFYVATTGTTNKFPITNSEYCLGMSTCWNEGSQNSSAIDDLLKTGMAGGVIPLDPFWKTTQYGDAFIYYADTNLSYIQWVMEDELGGNDQHCGRGLVINTNPNGLNDYVCELYL
jgi:prepilin-type N-terminal cleavage/methylation domain-containing protein